MWLQRVKTIYPICFYSITDIWYCQPSGEDRLSQSLWIEGKQQNHHQPPFFTLLSFLDFWMQNCDILHLPFTFLLSINPRKSPKQTTVHKCSPAAQTLCYWSPFLPTEGMYLFENGSQRHSDIIKERQGSFLNQQIILEQEWTVYLLGNPF